MSKRVYIVPALRVESTQSLASVCGSSNHMQSSSVNTTAIGNIRGDAPARLIVH